MRAVTDFLPFVTPYAYGVSDPMAEQAIVSTCIEFCNATFLVQNTSWEDAVADQSDVDVEVPPMMTLAGVLRVYFKDVELTARARELVSRGSAARGSAVPTVTVPNGTPTEWFNRDPAEPIVSVYPPPADSEDAVFTLVAAHAPTRTATRVADILYDDYAEEIGAGAVARLLLMPAQQFTNPTAAIPYRQQFRAAVSAAATRARLGMGSATSRVRSVRFA
jgi:hypothetical protein